MLSRRSLLASTAALAAGCSFAEPPLDAPSVPQAVALNVAASTFRYLSFLHQFFEVEPEDKHRRTLAMLEADKENPYGPTRGRYSLTLRFFGELYPMPAVSQTAEEQKAASLEIAAALLEELKADLVMVSRRDARLLGQHGLLLPLSGPFSGRMGTDLEREFFPRSLVSSVETAPSMRCRLARFRSCSTTTRATLRCKVCRQWTQAGTGTTW